MKHTIIPAIALAGLLLGGCATHGPYRVTTTKGVYHCRYLHNYSSDGKNYCGTGDGFVGYSFIVPGEIIKVEEITSDGN